jgi:hypothetical protein
MSFFYVSDESERASNPTLSMLCLELISSNLGISKILDCGGKEKDTVGKVSNPPESKKRSGYKE